MVINVKLISPEQVIASTREALGLGAQNAGHAVDEALIAQLLRAIAWSNCPCHPSVLIREAERALQGLVPDADSLRARAIHVLDDLVATGDLLEPGQVSYAAEWTKGLLFPAPPSFAMLNKETAQLFGVASEEELEGPPELIGRIVYDGSSRRVTARVGEALECTLRVAGLRELSMQAWLGEPDFASPKDFLAAAKQRLKRAEPADASVDALEVFDSTSGGIYSACWVTPRDRSGLFVARRPKAYGSNLWMLVDLANGLITRLVHLPTNGSSFRGCDEAWQTQLALDSVNGNHQKYRVRQDGGAVHLDMLFPLPRWAHRHMLVLGRQSSTFKSICTYQVPETLLSEAQSFLEQRLWLKTTD